jgi:hypothetical protein
MNLFRACQLGDKTPCSISFFSYLESNIANKKKKEENTE